MGGFDTFWYLTMSPGASCPLEYSLVVAEGSDTESESVSEVRSLVGFSLGGLGSGWDLQKEGHSRIHGGFQPHCWSSMGKLTKASHSIFLRVVVHHICDHGAAGLVGTLLSMLRHNDCWTGVEPVPFLKKSANML